MKDDTGLPQPGDVVGGKYRVARAIGAGGMGTVFKATHEVTHKTVALKWLRPKFAAEPLALKRFIREAQASARIRHPNVVDIYDVEEQEGCVFLVLELLEGETLRSILQRATLGIGESLALLVPAMRGVAAAHAQGVVHRDIKPDNLFITKHPDHPEIRVPKVLDFGISKVAADTPLAEGTLTATGATLGTPHYMSLEQLQGEPIDIRSDIYAFGVVLYECLTGKRPFDSENFSAIVIKVATETPTDPILLRPDLPPALRDVILKAMARHREDRYQSIQELIDALLPFISEKQALINQSIDKINIPVQLEQQPQPDSEMFTKTSRRKRESIPSKGASNTRWALVAVALVALTGGALWLFPPALESSESSESRPAETKHESVPKSTSARPPSAVPTSNPVDPIREPQVRESAARAQADPPALPKGADSPPSSRVVKASRFKSGWVYLGNHDGGKWVTRFFNGWTGALPPIDAKITARGRSFVRSATPDEIGRLAGIMTTIGKDNPVEVLEVVRWFGGRYVWARVRPAW